MSVGSQPIKQRRQHAVDRAPCAAQTVSPLQRGMTVASPAPSMPASVSTPHQHDTAKPCAAPASDHPPLGLERNPNGIGFDVGDFHDDGHCSYRGAGRLSTKGRLGGIAAVACGTTGCTLEPREEAPHSTDHACHADRLCQRRTLRRAGRRAAGVRDGRTRARSPLAAASGAVHADLAPGDYEVTLPRTASAPSAWR